MSIFTIFQFKRKFLLCFFSIILILFFYSCTKASNNEPIISINRILPLGASRTAGNSPKQESYRYDLWKLLIDDGCDFDFIGTMQDNALYPSYKNLNFDVDHEGHSGWNTIGMLDGLKGWLKQTGSPDIVIFESPGGNDFLQGKPYEQTVDNIRKIVDVLQENNPHVTILIGQNPPVRDNFMTPEISDALTNIRNDIKTIATEKSTPTSKIIAVDDYTGFSNDYFADNIHFNKAGANFIANKFYNELKTILKR